MGRKKKKRRGCTSHDRNLSQKNENSNCSNDMTIQSLSDTSIIANDDHQRRDGVHNMGFNNVVDEKSANYNQVVASSLNSKKRKMRQQQHSTYYNDDEAYYYTQQQQQVVGVSDHIMEQNPLFLSCKLGDGKACDHRMSFVSTEACCELEAEKYKHMMTSQNSNYYNDIMQQNYITSTFNNNNNNNNNHDQEESSNNCLLEVRSNWLKRVYSITSHYHQQQQNRREENLLISRYYTKQDEMRQIILTLQSQLLDLKCQFRPMAQTCATIWNNLSQKRRTTLEREFALARGKANPMECLGQKKQVSNQNANNNNPFINRSAMKLANMDALLNFCLTRTTIRNNNNHNHQLADDNDSNLGKDEHCLFSFVDLCGAPGGFTEYILKRKLPYCQGYGMSLQGRNKDGTGVPWKVQHLFPDTTNNKTCCNEKKNVFRICKGVDGTGDIYNWENVMELQKQITSPNSSRSSSNVFVGVDLVVADGGFDAQRDEHDQEKMALQIITCQTAAALVLLQEKGNFVVKMFGFQHDITRNIMLKLFHAFDQLIFLKPVTSRPASSERYLVCLGYNREKHHKNMSNNENANAPNNSTNSNHEVVNVHVYKWRETLIQSIIEEQLSSSITDNNVVSHQSKNVETASRQIDSQCHNSLFLYLDYMDRDMLQLNVDSCKNILLQLERKIHKAQLNVKGLSEEQFVDGNLYRQAWEIGSKMFGVPFSK